jgi:hypothetical protein
MKNVRKITKLQLENDLPENMYFYGLVCAEPDYKLSLALNSILKISLKAVSPVIPVGEKDFDPHFSRFSYVAHSSAVFTLISNRSEKEFLFKKLKNIDYILMIEDQEDEIDPALIMTDLRKTTSVTAVFRIDADSRKDRNIQYLII